MPCQRSAQGAGQAGSGPVVRRRPDPAEAEDPGIALQGLAEGPGQKIGIVADDAQPAEFEATLREGAGQRRLVPVLALPAQDLVTDDHGADLDRAAHVP
jgi:hypothetical protein